MRVIAMDPIQESNFVGDMPMACMGEVVYTLGLRRCWLDCMQVPPAPKEAR